MTITCVTIALKTRMAQFIETHRGGKSFIVHRLQVHWALCIGIVLPSLAPENQKNVSSGKWRLLQWRLVNSATLWAFTDTHADRMGDFHVSCKSVVRGYTTPIKTFGILHCTRNSLHNRNRVTGKTDTR